MNSNVPVTIAPQNIQAIVTGSGENYGQIKYIKAGLSEELVDESIVYTSGTGAIFKSGVPIGKLDLIKLVLQIDIMLNSTAILHN